MVKSLTTFPVKLRTDVVRESSPVDPLRQLRTIWGRRDPRDRSSMDEAWRALMKLEPAAPDTTQLEGGSESRG